MGAALTIETIGVRDRGAWGGQLPPPPTILENHGNFGQTLGKIKKIRANLSENMLKSGYFITILRKNSGKLSTAPPPPPQKTSAPFSYDRDLTILGRQCDGDGEKQTPSNKW